MAMNIAGAAILFLFHLLLARELELADYGYLSILISWLNALVIFAKFGQDGASLKFVSVYSNDEASDTSRKHFITSTYLVALVCSVIVCAAWYFLGPKVVEVTLLGNLLLLSVALIGIYALVDIQAAILRGFGFILVSIALRRLLIPLLSFGMLIYLVFLRSEDLTLEIVIPLLLLANGTALLIQLIFIIRSNRGFLSFDKFRMRREWLGMSGPVFVTSGVQALIKQVDIIMVGYFLGAQSAGIYAVCTRLTRFTRIGFSAANTVTAPLFASIFAKNRLDELQGAASNSIKATLIMSMPLILVFSLFGEFVLGLYGNEYIAGYTILLILLSGELVNVLSGQNGSMLNMTGKHTLLARIEVSVLCLNLLLLYLFINWWGLNGAAIAVAVSLIVRNVWVTQVAKKYRGVDPSVWSLLKPKSESDS